MLETAATITIPQIVRDFKLKHFQQIKDRIDREWEAYHTTEYRKQWTRMYDRHATD